VNEQILQEITDFCRQRGLAESTFGRRAVNDGKLASRLRNGGRITTETLERIRSFMSRTHGAALPLLDFQCEVTSHSDPDTSYQINLNHPKCTCPDWQTRRYKLPDGHLSKCCKHIFGAYQQAEIDDLIQFTVERINTGIAKPTRQNDR